MTPGILAAKKAKVSYAVHEYEHDPSAPSYGNEAAEKMGVDPNQVFKTLVLSVDGKGLAVAILPVTHLLSLKRFAKAAGAKKAAMADQQDVLRSTGYVLGGVSPLGQKKRLKTYIDASAQQYHRIFVSAGKRGLELELAPADLARLTDGHFAPLQQD